MLANPKNMEFLLILTSGTLISMSSTSWYGAWMGLEVNLLSFIPLISKTNNQRSTEASLKYFLTQALASTLLITAVLLTMQPALKLTSGLQTSMMNVSLLMKMGAAPFHFWMPEVMEGINWMECMLLMTIQKLAPMTLLSYTASPNYLMMTAIMMSVIIGSLGGLNQTSLRKVMAFSSITHIGWMLAGMICSDKTWSTYLWMYIILTVTSTLLFLSHKTYHLNQILTPNLTPITKMAMFTSLLSLGGLPPFLGFYPKWITIIKMVQNNHNFIITAMVIMTLLTLFYYLRIAVTSLTLNYSMTMMNWQSNRAVKMEQLATLTSISISLTGLILASMTSLTSY